MLNRKSKGISIISIVIILLMVTSGIVLAEDNYLPVDKRGNVNVLVVGRIWIW